MSYQSIHTAYGLAKIAEAETTGVAINLTHIAVGDGGGNPVTPSELQTQLVREMHRTTVNRVYQNDDDPMRLTVEMVIPASVGGFTMREVGVFDADGALFVVGNLPDAYKPMDTEGAYADTVIRVEFVVSNATVITLQVDPNVAIASQAWVLNTVTFCALVPGGITGQVLRKASNDCGAVEWADPTEASVVVDVIEERQALADLQTTVTWSTVTTHGLAVYIDGLRIPRGSGVDEWDADPTMPDTRIILGQAYTAGAEIVGVQNDPLGGVDFPLARDQNLADVPDKPQARANLDIYSKSETRQMAPAGMVAHFARSTAPTGWLKANGAAISRTAYADLFAAIGTTFGAGDGFSTFNLPDLRGEFLRGWDDGRGADPGRAFGGYQSPASNFLATFETARNPYGALSEGASSVPWDGSWSSWRRTGRSPDGDDDQIRFRNDGTTDIRPRNRALLACIKF